MSHHTLLGAVPAVGGMHGISVGFHGNMAPTMWFTAMYIIIADLFDGLRERQWFK